MLTSVEQTIPVRMVLHVSTPLVAINVDVLLDIKENTAIKVSND